MPSGRDYLDYVLDQLSEIEGIAWKRMMGEYLLYVKGKLIGGIYDNRFLVKPTKGAHMLMPGAVCELPYEGARPMLLVEDMENRELLAALCRTLYDELPEAKKK